MTYFILDEAIKRLQKPEEISGWVMILIAALGLVANLVMLRILGHHGHSHGGDDHGHGHNEEDLENSDECNDDFENGN